MSETTPTDRELFGGEPEWQPSPAVDNRLSARKYDLPALIRDSQGDPPWRVAGFAADGFVTVLAGSGGEGKSWLAMELCAGVASGTPVGGLECVEGAAVYLDAENGRWIVGNRLSRFDELPPLERFAFYGAEGYDLRSYDDLAEIETVIRAEQARLVVIDSLRVLTPGAKENDSDVFAPVLANVAAIARRTGAAVIVLHHRDKQRQADYRGSGAIHDQTDLLFVLERHGDDPERAWRRRLRTSKCRIAPEPPERWIGLRANGATMFITEAEPYSSAPLREAAQQKMLDELAKSETPLSGRELGRRLGVSEATARRGLDQLASVGDVERGEDGWRCVTDG